MKSRFAINPKDPTPLYAQLESAICRAIAEGRLTINAQLPTVRELAVELRVNANTVAKVYAELERRGVLETQRGVGTFVRAQPPRDDRAAEKMRKKRLETLVDQFLRETLKEGFSADEISQALQKITR